MKVSEKLLPFVELALTEKLEEVYPNSPSIRKSVFDATMKGGDNPGISQETYLRATEMMMNEHDYGFVF